MTEPVAERDALENVLSAMGEVAVAVSGGVDSLTLAAFAHRQLGKRCTMFHAVSAAVPSLTMSTSWAVQMSLAQ